MNIIFNNTNILVHDASKTILEHIEFAGINVDSQCRSGMCGVCKRKIISGKFEYKQIPLAYTSGKDILICIAMINTDINIK
ncbi:MAG: ferredoxin [Francisellaceae bacterium]